MEKVISFTSFFCLLSFFLFISFGKAENTAVKDCITKNQIMDPVYMGKGIHVENMEDEQDITLKELVERSKIIIIGKVVSMIYPTIQMGNFKKEPGFNVCKIEVIKVLKGDPNLKIVSLAMPHAVNMGEIYRWSGPIYTCDLKGVWFLNKIPTNVPKEVIKAVHEKGDYYFANSRERYKELNGKLIKEVILLIEQRSGYSK